MTNMNKENNISSQEKDIYSMSDNHICILISCMHQNDHSIIYRSNVQNDVVVVNQCNKDQIEEFEFKNIKGVTCKATFISTKERGLSKSRNLAIKYAPENSICLVCDDDEVIAEDIEEKINEAYHRNPEAAAIVFSLERKDSNKKYPQEWSKLKFRQILKTGSQQITFRKNLINNIIVFDEKMGSGTGNGGGEEIKFLLDIRRKRLQIYYAPLIIATILPSESQWWEGFTENYMRNLAWSSRRALGNVLGYLYLWYQALYKYPHYKNQSSFMRILSVMHEGYMSKR